ncbi:hypothetical protein Cabys_160 [Caldithrix abyssi DSM 13497]|uniref:Uncharacterized protein n=1 Tax=Caldithrix abyssi DSM 13497 TaxID=880073 RepID=A0A1J1C2N7_CALAY|nr:hypothetical protein Cabys_160 [Caldithrix abyssi DSM 13497]
MKKRTKGRQSLKNDPQLFLGYLKSPDLFKKYRQFCKKQRRIFFF